MLKVVRDEPGRQLLLEAERPRVAASVRGGIALLAVLFIGYRVVGTAAELGRMRSEAPPLWALNLFLSLGAVTLALRVYRWGWRPSRVRADADASELELTDWNAVTGMERRDVIPLDHLAGLTVKLVPWGAGGRVARGVVPRVQVTVTLDERARRRAPPPRAFGVEGVDRPADVADLANRLGAATGMAYRRVLRSDAEHMEVELSVVMGPGGEKLEPVAAAADYVGDVVSPAALVAAEREVLPPFDPSSFEGDCRVTRWSPGDEVRMKKPFAWGTLGCLPPTLASLFLGPACYLLQAAPHGRDLTLADLAGLRWSGDVWGRLPYAVMAGLMGLAPCVILYGLIRGAWPRRVAFDWTRRTIKFRGVLLGPQVSFDDVTAVEVTRVRTPLPGPTGSYLCEVHLEVQDRATSEARRILLVRTTPYVDDRDTPYAQAVPLGTELAEAMGVEYRVREARRP